MNASILQQEGANISVEEAHTAKRLVKEEPAGTDSLEHTHSGKNFGCCKFTGFAVLKYLQFMRIGEVDGKNLALFNVRFFMECKIFF